jgi:hypothetical protein
MKTSDNMEASALCHYCLSPLYEYEKCSCYPTAIDDLTKQLADCQRWSSAWKRLARRLRKSEYEYWNNYCDQFEETKEVKLQREAAVAALLDAKIAIESLDDDALGWGYTDDIRWPLRSELLSKIEAALALCDE